jgi:deazaflavin-dependent oxidoreductase (nitroreductase family)
MPMTTLKRRLATTFSGFVANPLAKLVAGANLPGVPALLETTGRKSGKRRHTPVGNGLRGDTFWLIAEHGRHSDYVRNVVADPRVRVKVNGTWRSGSAHLMPEDDPRARQGTLDPLNAAIVRLVGTELLTVRIDLDRGSGSV